MPKEIVCSVSNDQRQVYSSVEGRGTGRSNRDRKSQLFLVWPGCLALNCTCFAGCLPLVVYTNRAVLLVDVKA